MHLKQILGVNLSFYYWKFIFFLLFIWQKYAPSTRFLQYELTIQSVKHICLSKNNYLKYVHNWLMMYFFNIGAFYFFWYKLFEPNLLNIYTFPTYIKSFHQVSSNDFLFHKTILKNQVLPNNSSKKGRYNLDDEFEKQVLLEKAKKIRKLAHIWKSKKLFGETEYFVTDLRQNEGTAWKVHQNKWFKKWQILLHKRNLFISKT